MTAAQFIAHALELVRQPYVQILAGLSIALLLRTISLAGVYVGSFVFPLLLKSRYNRLNKELRSFVTFRNQPSELIARSMLVLLGMIITSVIYFDVLAFSAATAPTYYLSSALSIAGLILCAIVGWLLIGLFFLARPLSNFAAYEDSSGDKINLIREKLQTLSKDLNPESDGEVAGEQSVDEGAQDPSHQGRASKAESVASADQEAVPLPPEESAVEAPSVFSDSQSEIQSQRPAVHGVSTGSSASHTEWISGVVTSWPDGALFGFISSDAGEEFAVDLDNIATTLPPTQGQEVMFRPVFGRPRRRATLVCSIGSRGQGQVSEVAGSRASVTILDRRNSRFIPISAPPQVLATLQAGMTIRFTFGKNLAGPLARQVALHQGRSGSNRGNIIEMNRR